MSGDIFSMFSQGESASTEPETVESVSFSEARKTVVLSVGGSLIAGEKPAAAYIAKLAETIQNLVKKGYKFVLVVGGGATARNYIAAGKALGAGAFGQDALGIAATRLNALLLVQGLENAHPKVLTNVEDAALVLDSGRTPVFGGLLPGITTDAVAALIAESLGAEFLNLTNVKGVYSKDPKEHPHAKFYPAISYARLLSMMRLAEEKPGQHKVMDTPACVIIQRSSIPTIVLDGSNMENLEAAIEGGEFEGTRVGENEEDELEV